MPPPRQFARDEVEQAVKASRSYNAAARALGYRSRSGGVLAVVKRHVEEYGIDVSHFGGKGVHTGRRPNFRYTPELLTEAVAASHTMSDVCRYLGISISSGEHVRKLLRQHGIGTDHFWSASERARRRYSNGRAKLTAENTLVLQPAGAPRVPAKVLRRLMLEAGVPHCCAACKCPPEWQGAPLVLQVDHENGRSHDNRLSNLRFLCPNCHAQSATWGYRGRFKPQTDRVESVPA